MDDEKYKADVIRERVLKHFGEAAVMKAQDAMLTDPRVVPNTYRDHTGPTKPSRNGKAREITILNIFDKCIDPERKESVAEMRQEVTRLARFLGDSPHKGADNEKEQRLAQTAFDAALEHGARFRAAHGLKTLIGAQLKR